MSDSLQILWTVAHQAMVHGILQAIILECEVKRALGSVAINKAHGGDGISAELFKILKDDAVKVLHSVCQKIWKTQQWPQDWKRSILKVNSQEEQY